MSQPDDTKRKEEETSEGVLLPVIGEIFEAVVEPAIELGVEVLGGLFE